MTKTISPLCRRFASVASGVLFSSACASQIVSSPHTVKPHPVPPMGECAALFAAGHEESETEKPRIFFYKIHMFTAVAFAPRDKNFWQTYDNTRERLTQKKTEEDSQKALTCVQQIEKLVAAAKKANTPSSGKATPEP